MVEKYLMESYKSFQKCRLANSVRRNSLVKKNHAIEAERKLVFDRIDREERLLKEHARNIQMEQTRTCSCRTTKERNLCASASRRMSTSGVVDSIDPYPVTFPRKTMSKKSSRQKCTTMEGIKDLKRGTEQGYRSTKEGEELCGSGKVTTSGHLSHPVRLVSSASWTGRGQGDTGNAQNAQEPLDESMLWVGDPEAIHSVRRARKSVAQQDMERYQRMRGH